MESSAIIFYQVDYFQNRNKFNFTCKDVCMSWRDSLKKLKFKKKFIKIDSFKQLFFLLDRKHAKKIVNSSSYL